MWEKISLPPGITTPAYRLHVDDDIFFSIIKQKQRGLLNRRNRIELHTPIDIFIDKYVAHKSLYHLLVWLCKLENIIMIIEIKIKYNTR